MEVIVPCGEADSDEVSEFKKFFGLGEIVIAEELNMRCLAAVLSKCSLYIGNDSGVSHLAAAAGAPSVCVFGPTDPGVWAPRVEKVIIAQSRVSCAPCLRDVRNSCVNQKCLELKPEDVLGAVRRVLD